MELQTLKRAARLARISALIAVHELASRALTRGEHLDDFLTSLKSALEKEMDEEAQTQMLAWAVR